MEHPERNHVYILSTQGFCLDLVIVKYSNCSCIGIYNKTHPRKGVDYNENELSSTHLTSCVRLVPLKSLEWDSFLLKFDTSCSLLLYCIIDVSYV